MTTPYFIAILILLTKIVNKQKAPYKIVGDYVLFHYLRL
jgi:hypothetical protein